MKSGPKGVAVPNDRPAPAEPAPQKFESDQLTLQLQGPPGGPAIGTTPIQEADVVRIDGDRVYALSRSTGLSIIDVSDARELKLLGRYTDLPGNPFEMHVRGDTLLLIYTGNQLVAPTPGGPVSTGSHLIALNVADPAAPERLSDSVVRGTIRASLVAGDVLYAMIDNSTACLNCGEPALGLASFALADPRAIARVDQLNFSVQQPGPLAAPSMSSSERRLYVTAPDLAAGASTVHVVDTSDRSGKLREAASVVLAGQITSPSQMSEEAGILRVVSHSPSQSETKPAQLNTFRIVSSQQVEALGRLDIPAPREGLRFARFDGPRAYVSVEGADVLYTFDLSDPAQPKQAARLELSNTLEFIEPLGDRVLGFGLRPSGSSSPLVLTLFDVHDLATPKEISQAAFGPRGAGPIENANRLRDQLRVERDAGLVFMPFANTDFGAGSKCFGRSQHGVQIFDLERDRVTARGVVPTVGVARRALLHDDQLLAVSDEQVASFSLRDRAKPEPNSAMVVASYVSSVAQLPNGVVARLVDANVDSFVDLEFVASSGAQDLNQRSSVVKVIDLISQDPATTCALMHHVESMHGDGTRLHVLYEAYYDSNGTPGKSRTGVLVLDLSDISAPKLIGKTEWPTEALRVDYYDQLDYARLNQARYVWQGTTLAVIEHEWSEANTEGPRYLRVMDFRDPAAPTTRLVPLTAEDAYVGLSIAGDTIFASRFHGQGSERIAYYLDRFDIADPAAPRAIAPINTPGLLLHYDAESHRAITLAYHRREITGQSLDCVGRFGELLAAAGAVVCAGFDPMLQLSELREDRAVLEDTLELEDGFRLRSHAAGDGVLFFSLGRGAHPSRFCPGICTGITVAAEPARLLVLSGLRSGRLQAGRLEIGSEQNGWVGYWQTPRVVAHDSRALLYGGAAFSLIDATDARAPALAHSDLLGNDWIMDVSALDDRALISIGYSSAQWVEM